MTRREFFERRARAEFLKSHAVTVCPPNEEPLASIQRRNFVTRMRKRGHTGTKVANGAQRMHRHAFEGESGEAVPVTSTERIARRMER